ncbi:Arm DNA-binding domain-containing protein [Gilliamella sp. W8145]|uniref:Arm DNA-binding domain-containing protein n=2 Tax=Gilliamella TaxID=1193503 RepID=UPI00351C3B4D
MSMSRLTNLGIRLAKAKSSVYTLFDGRGLGLRIEPSGAKRWHFRFYWQYKQQRISFGFNG